MIKQNIVCEGTRLDVQERCVRVGNKFKYDVNGKCNQQERKVYPQDKYCEHKISYRDVGCNMEDFENSSRKE
jgi:hypothetical protein